MPVSLSENVYNELPFVLQYFIIVFFFCHHMQQWRQQQQEIMTKITRLTQYSNVRKSYHLYYLHVLLMDLFLVTDSPLILIKLLNFYGVLSEGFLISDFCPRG